MGGVSPYGRWLLISCVLLLVSGLVGCTTTSSIPHQSKAEAKPSPAKLQQPAHRALATAVDMVGVPYRYGGSNPSGFDCSGLVYYSYRKAGIDTPRTSKEQYRQTQRVKVSQLQPGDLVFFRISRDKVSHVAIYAGDGRFIHAPSSGGSVGYASLHNAYWQDRLTGAGRFQ